MCNLSQGVLQRGRDEGKIEGKIEIAQKLIMRKSPIDDIMDLTGLSLEMVQDLISNRKDYV